MRDPFVRLVAVFYHRPKDAGERKSNETESEDMALGGMQYLYRRLLRSRNLVLACADRRGVRSMGYKVVPVSTGLDGERSCDRYSESLQTNLGTPRTLFGSTRVLGGV